MYHQPSAPTGQGGPYMFQWNDDNCETKNNFICKYIAERLPDPPLSPNSTQNISSMLPWHPRVNNQGGNTALNLIYIIIPTIPLLLLLLTVTGVCCFKLLVKRKKKQQKSEHCQTDLGLAVSTTPTDVYNIIRSQKDDDLLSARPNTKNTSFICSSPDTPTGDYDNLGGRDTESGFVTLASTESCFLNFDLSDLTLGRLDTYYDASLGRSVKKDLKDRDFYDRSLGRRTTKSEHYGTGVYRDHGLYDGSVRGSDLYDPKLRLGSRTVKADLYQTYVSNGKEDTYKTSLGPYENRKSYQSNLDYYRNGLTLDGRKRYINEQEWIDKENYWSSK
ncbi:layilin [Antennarius striatus]|uniref:layilin n=1 Tax=Antennarius striatus TaxID=241820 RepID=UPI0035B2D91C